MNQPIDTTLMVIIILLLVLIIVLVIIAGLVFANYLKSAQHTSKELLEKSKENENPVTQPGRGTCKNHEHKNSVGICAICEEEFCIDCLKQIDKVNLCPEHFNTFADNIWHPITNQRTTPEDPKDGVYIYEFKQQLWKERGIPSYILNEYKIQVENDYIETYVQLHVKEDDKETLSKDIFEFKGSKQNEK